MRLAEAALAEERAVERARASSRSPVQIQPLYDDDDESETDIDDDEYPLPPSNVTSAPQFTPPVISVDASDGADGGRRDVNNYNLPARKQVAAAPSTGAAIPRSPRAATQQWDDSRPASPTPPISISIPVPQISFPDDEGDGDVEETHNRSPSITISSTPTASAKVQMGGPASPVTELAYLASPLPNIPTHGYGLRCAGCHNPIVGRIVSAMGKRWHPACFKCV